MTDPRSDEAMDACRRDPADLEWPETRDLAARLDREGELRLAFQERLEQDALIAARLRRVPFSGTSRARLAERIGAQLELVPPAEAVGATSPSVVTVGDSVSASRSRWAFRKSSWIAALVTSVAVLLWVGWGLYPGRWTRVGARELANWALQEWQPSSDGWRRMQFKDADQGTTPVSNWLRKSPARWQPLETHLDRASAVYEIPSKKRPSRLFVLHADRKVPGLPNRPPQQPQTEQSGCFFAAWQEDSRVYVLSVPGPLRNYWDVVQAPSAFSSDRTRGAESVRN